MKTTTPPRVFGDIILLPAVPTHRIPRPHPLLRLEARGLDFRDPVVWGGADARVDISNLTFDLDPSAPDSDTESESESESSCSGTWSSVTRRLSETIEIAGGCSLHTSRMIPLSRDEGAALRALLSCATNSSGSAILRGAVTAAMFLQNVYLDMVAVLVL